MAKYVPRDFWLQPVLDAINPFGCLLFFTLLWVWLPLLPFHFLWHRWRCARFIRNMQKQGRILRWAEFLADVRERPGGTVVIEVGNKAPTRFWRTPDAVRVLSPIEPPATKDVDFFTFGGANQHPFKRWCYEQYLAPDGGTVHPKQSDFRTSPMETEKFEAEARSRFPGSDVIVMTFYDARFI